MGAPLAKDYSEETAEVIDHEVKAILDAQYLVAKQILTKHHQILNEGAALVLEDETIEGDRLKALLDAKPSD
jgi:ATP-dependent Zn protease